MGFAKIVSIQDIKKDNPRLCLSALRYTGHCFKCPVYVSTTGKPCNSRIESEEGKQYFKIEAEKKALAQKIKELKKRQSEIE